VTTGTISSGKLSERSIQVGAFFLKNPIPSRIKWRKHSLATFIPDETIKDIQQAADIVEVVSKRVLLKKAGKNFTGLCPFHTEKTPSFSVNPEKKIFYCFGCGTGGDVFSFFMKLDGMSFPEAVRQVASLCGIEILNQTFSPAVRKVISDKEKIYKINDDAATFYHELLCRHTTGQNAMAYLLRRDISLEIVETFKIGYAPSGWNNLAGFFARQKIPAHLIERAGLIIARKAGNGYYDRFRDRIILPIFNASRRVIGMGGRVMDDSLPKYLNSPETLVYQKSRSLYGIHSARQACREKSLVYVVEGYFDAIALYHFGIKNVVATLGTSLTAEHVKILRGFVGENGKAILVYDSDDAGIKAATRSIGIFEAGFLKVQILILPSGYDPDTYIREYGREKFLFLSQNAFDIIPFLLEIAIKKYGLTIDGKVRIIQDLVGSLVALKDSVARGLYVRNIGERLDIDEHAILEKIKQTIQQKRNQREPSDQSVGTSNSVTNYHNNNNILDLNKRVRIEQKLIAMMLHFPAIIPEIVERQIIEQIQDETLALIGRMILETNLEINQPVNAVISRIQNSQVHDDSRSNDKIKRIISSLAISEDKWDLQGCRRLLVQFEHSVKRSGDDLLEQIKVAEKNNDIDILKKLLLKKQLRVKPISQS
jgi:DNA primase